MWIFASNAAVSTRMAFILVTVTIFSAVRVRSVKDEDKSTRVVGGHLARKGEVPYIVAIYADTHIGRIVNCGGSIYNKRFIITAAHCLGSQLTNLEIVAGTVDHTQTGDGNAQVIKVKRVILHEEFDPFLNDIGLLELEKDLEYNSAVQPIPIPPAGLVSSGKAKLSGWGVTKVRKADAERGHVTDKLMTLDNLRIIPREACDKYFKEIPEIEVFETPPYSGIGVQVPASTIMCAGRVPPGGKDSCLGDSGGPLQCTREVGNKSERYLCGVVSSGYGCGLALPGSYTEVAKFTDWIVQHARV